VVNDTGGSINDCSASNQQNDRVYVTVDDKHVVAVEHEELRVRTIVQEKQRIPKAKG